MYKLVKQLLDFILSLILIILLIFPMIVIAITIKFTSKESPIYWSLRVGKNGKLFKMPKFRSMSGKTPQVATHLMANPDEFMSSTGKFIRKTSLDELPQLFSILKGDMSLVGPRPLTSDIFDLYDEEVKSHVLQVRPGLSGVGSIIFRDEENLLVNKSESREFYEKHISKLKGDLEIWYVNNSSLKIYIVIILSTLLILFTKRNNPLEKYLPDVAKLNSHNVR